jgi:HK97 family phage portal protein
VILATRRGDAELRSIDFSATSTIYPPGGGMSVDGSSWAARLVDMRDAVGLTAVGAAIRLIQSQVAAMPLGAYSNPDGSFVPQPGSWQSELFADPSPGEWTAYTFLEDIVGSGESTANAFIEKVKPKRPRAGQPTVAEMRPLDPDYCAVRRDKDTGRKVILWQGASGQQDITDRVLHIRGSSLKPAPAGKSVLRMHGRALAMHLALEEYQGRYFENDARPSFILSHPQQQGREQRRDIREGFMAKHSGSGNSHGLGLLWGGWTATPFGSALRDTQAVELSDRALREVALMFQIPQKLLGSIAERPVRESTEEEFTRLFRICLFGRLRRIELAFSGDPDLFGGSPLSARFDPSELLRADTATTASVIHNLIQVGVMTANEGRALLSMPRSTDPKADELLATPVGGGANDPPALPADPPPGQE